VLTYADVCRRLLKDTFENTDKELMKLPAFLKAKDGSTAIVSLY
jgi:hypothetical protein